MEDSIHEALDNGYENNPEIALWSPSDLAADLQLCDQGCENLTLMEIIPHCETWLVQFAGRP